MNKPENISILYTNHLLFIFPYGLVTIICFFSIVTFAQDLNQIHVSEFMASNSNTLMDEDGDYPDWIELYNPTASSIDLDGWYISDNPEDLIKWIIPKVSIEANGYLLIYSSGKDKRTGEFHTNFKLSSSGEQICLTKPDGESIAFKFDGNYPAQFPDISYGFIDGILSYFDIPTPNQPNVIGEYLTPPSFSLSRGFYNEPTSLDIFTNKEGGIIKYTLDGSEPGLENGLVYASSLIIDSTTVVRAVVTNAGKVSRVTTHTYIFPEKVKNQPRLPDGYPEFWGKYSKIEGHAHADYEMDPNICQSPDYAELIVPALKAIPTISLVTKKDNLFSFDMDPVTGGIYIHTGFSAGGLGEDWERPASIEYFSPDNTDGFQVNCGIKIHGGASRVPEKNPKHSFRIMFKEEFGPKKLNYNLFGETATESFNSIILRGGFNQTWLHWDDAQRQRAQYINDSWAKDMYKKMGHKAAHNKFVHLYINGLYWGLYNISERMDDDFMDYYFEGNKEDFDVIKDYAEIAEGNADAWNRMMQMAEDGLSDAGSFYRIQGKDEFGLEDESIEALLDVDNLIDFMILNFYAGNKDWDHHNWVAVRNRENPMKGFQFLPWDSERIFNGIADNMVDENNENRPSFLYTQLRKNPVFRIQFATRANELLGPGGVLSPDSVIAVWQKRSEEIELAIIAESARWGDYRRDVHPYKNGPYQLYTKNDHWLEEQNRLIEHYFPARSQIVLDQLKAIGLAGDIVTGADSEIDEILAQSHDVFPNPFNKKVTIRYSLEKPGPVVVEIYSKEGKVVKKLFSGYQSEGIQEIEWKPGKVLSGLYFYHIQTDIEIRIGKMIFVK